MSHKETTLMRTEGAKDGFGALLDAAQREPVTITKKGRAVAVVLSRDDDQRLEALEDAHWRRQAQEARKEGFVGPEARE